MFPFDHKYPGTDLHEIDLYYVLQQIKALREIVENFVDLNKISYADPIYWDITKQYPAAQIVKDPVSGVLYMSKQPVPVDIALTNTDYWLEIGNFEYETGFIKDAICANDEGSSSTSSGDYEADAYLWWNDKLYKTLEAISTGDTLTEGVNVKKTSVTDNLVPEVPVPEIDDESSSDTVTFTRYYYEEAENIKAPDGTAIRQIESIAVTDQLLYISAHNSTYSRLTLIDRTQFTAQHIFFVGISINCMALDPVYNRIYFSDAGIAKYIDLANYEVKNTNISDRVQAFGYDEVNDILYMKGLTDYTQFFIVNRADNTAEKVFRIDNYLQSGVLQDFSANDGHIYWTQSNPNIIYKYSAGDGSVERIYNLSYRMDKILPVGELEAVTFHKGTCYISGYNRSMLSGKKFVNVIGEYSFKTGVASKSVDYRTFPQILYVDPDWSYSGNGKYTATGWISSYFPKPFTDLWEAIEAAAGLHSETGVRVQISINSPGHTFRIGRIPGDSITQIDGNYYGRGDNDPYQYILMPIDDYIYIENGNITIARALFKANTNNVRIIIVRRCTLSLQNCAVLNPYIMQNGSIFESQQGAIFSSTSEVTSLDNEFSGESIKTDYITNYQNYAYANGGLVDMSTRVPYKNIKLNSSGSGVVAGNAYIHYVMTENDQPNTNILVAVMPGISNRPCITIRYNYLIFQFAGPGTSMTQTKTVEGVTLTLSISGNNVRVRSASFLPGDIIEFIS